MTAGFQPLIHCTPSLAGSGKMMGHELGLAVGDRVAIVSHNSARLLTSFFGVSGWGRVLVPVNFRLRPDEVRYIVEHSGARVLIIDPELEESLKDVEAEFKLVLGDDDACASALEISELRGIEGDEWVRSVDEDSALPIG